MGRRRNYQEKVTTDIVPLERLPVPIKKDTRYGHNLTNAARRSADIIEKAIGAPIAWPDRESGAFEADEVYPGNPAQRLAFNAGVKWNVERYSATEYIREPYPDVRRGLQHTLQKGTFSPLWPDLCYPPPVTQANRATRPGACHIPECPAALCTGHAIGCSRLDTGMTLEWTDNKARSARQYAAGPTQVHQDDSQVIANLSTGASAIATDDLASWLTGFARLSPSNSPCPGFRHGEWPEVHAQAKAFLERFGPEASRKGWSGLALFGVHATVGVANVNACGALMLPGPPAEEITADWISFGQTRYYRHAPQQSAVLVWEFGREG